MTHVFVSIFVLLCLGCSGAKISRPQTSERPGNSVAARNIMVDTTAASCEAKNETGGKCSISCPLGEKAYCQDAAGAGTPTCECLKEK
jgi:hypothetical protein